jgi:hypothetical protein
MNSSGLLTRWIDAEGARRIMVEAGILEHEIPIAEFSVADRDRQDTSSVFSSRRCSHLVLTAEPDVVRGSCLP